MTRAFLFEGGTLRSQELGIRGAGGSKSSLAVSLLPATLRVHPPRGYEENP